MRVHLCAIAILLSGCSSDPSDPSTGFETESLPSGYTSSGNAPWTTVTTMPRSGSRCAESGDIGDNQTSSMSRTVTLASDGTLTFWVRTSTESNYDNLQTFIDGTMRDQWSGTTPWTMVSYPLTSGTHTVEWRYSKDGSVSSGSDAVWVDDVSLGSDSMPLASPVHPAVAFDFDVDAAIESLRIGAPNEDAQAIVARLEADLAPVDVDGILAFDWTSADADTLLQDDALRAGLHALLQAIASPPIALIDSTDTCGDADMAVRPGIAATLAFLRMLSGGRLDTACSPSGLLPGLSPTQCAALGVLGVIREHWRLERIAGAAATDITVAMACAASDLRCGDGICFRETAASCAQDCAPPEPDPERCGDSVLDPLEECDDGNTLDGDGCSSTCMDEAGAPRIAVVNGEDCFESAPLDGRSNGFLILDAVSTPGAYDVRVSVGCTTRSDTTYQLTARLYPVTGSVVAPVENEVMPRGGSDGITLNGSVMDGSTGFGPHHTYCIHPDEYTSCDAYGDSSMEYATPTGSFDLTLAPDGSTGTLAFEFTTARVLSVGSIAPHRLGVEHTVTDGLVQLRYRAD